MDKESKDMLMKYLELGAEKLESGAQFLESEIPLVVSEYLSWIFYYNVIMLCIGILFLIIGSVCGIIAKRNYDYLDSPDSGDHNFILAIFSSIVTVFLFIFGCGNIFDSTKTLVKVSVAPRVVILEKISEISK